MPIRINVPGAADSGKKFAPASMTEQRADWTCSQGHRNRGYCLRCLTSGCGEKRPT